MKFIFLIFLLPILAFSQSDTLIPVTKSKFVTLGIFNNATLLQYRIYKPNGWVWRMGLDGTYSSATNKETQSNLPDELTKQEQKSVNISMGFHKRVYATSKLESFVGTEISVGFSSSNTFKTSNQMTYNSSTGSIEFDYQEKAKIDKSYFSPIFRPVLGFNYFFSKGISLGAEYRIPLFYTIYELKSTYTYDYYDLLGNRIQPNKPTSDNAYSTSNLKIGLLGQAVVTLNFRIR